MQIIKNLKILFPEKEIKEFFGSDKFLPLVSIILIIAMCFDMNITHYVLISNPEIFYTHETSKIAKNYLGTENWWIFSFGRSVGDSFFILIAYYFNPNKNLKYTTSLFSYTIRILIFSASIQRLILPLFWILYV